MQQTIRLALCFLLCGASLLACSRQPAAEAPQLTDPGYHRVLQSKDVTGKVVGQPADHESATIFVVFASWCGPCRHELAILGELRRADPDLRIIGLNAYEEWGEQSDLQRLQQFLSQSAPWLQVIRADASLLASFGGVPKIPTMFVYDRNGTQVSAFRRETRAIPPGKAEIASAIAAAREKLKL